LNGCNDHVNTFSKIDNPTGSVAILSHWNCWYGTRKHTTLRLISNRSTSSDNDDDDENTTTATSKPTLISTKFDDIFHRATAFNQRHTTSGIIPFQNNNKPTVLGMITERRRMTAEYAHYMEAGESIHPKYIVTEREMDAVEIHPDDPKFYPGNYRLWRFHLPNLETNTTSTHSDPKATDITANSFGGEEKMKTTENTTQDNNTSYIWRAYHRLNDREKLMIEYKLGQKINTILWTRWPNATIDKYDPDDPQILV
jgi:hypothetical protein